jgi:hypothetical protein
MILNEAIEISQGNIPLHVQRNNLGVLSNIRKWALNTIIIE